MATVDDKFIERLDDFTKSLEGIVEILKDESKKKNVDPVNTLAKSIGDELHKVVDNLQKVSKKVDVIEKDTKEILKELKAAKEKKKERNEGGTGLQNIAEVDNKKKIVEAIKIIGLITASIVAVGLALKLVSPVSMGTAIGIGLSIVLITGAFVAAHKMLGDTTVGKLFNVSKMMILMAGTLLAASAILTLAPTISITKALSLTFVAGALGLAAVLMIKSVQKVELNPKDYAKLLMLPLILPLIALGITLSSRILSAVVPLTLGQAFTSILIGGAIGLILYGMSKTLGKTELKPGTILGFLLLPIIVPALALGIVLASAILKNVSQLTLRQAISAIFVAGTIGLLIYLLKPIIEKTKGITAPQIFGLMGIIIALSAGIVASSYILGAIYPFTFREALGVLMTSIAIGISILFLVPAVHLLKKIRPEEAAIAALNIVIMSTAIMGSSLILSLGNYDYYPGMEWSFGVGLSIITFAGAIFIINKMKMKPTEMLTGAAAMIGISAVIMAVSLILGIGNYDIYPSLSWTMGVGLSLVAFGGAMAVIGILLAATGGTGAIMLLAGGAAILGIAATILATSLILAQGDYSEYPSLSWVFGVGAALLSFSAIGLVSILGLIGLPAIIATAGTVVLVSKILSKGDYDNGPSEEWAKGSMFMLKGTATLAAILAPLTPIILLGNLAIRSVAKNIVKVAEILNEGDYTGGPTKQWAEGVGDAIKSFAFAIMTLNKTGGIFGSILGIDQSRRIVSVATAMVDANKIIGSVDWTGNHPTEAWSRGVGGAINAFAQGLLALSKSDNIIGKIFGTQDQSLKIIQIASAMRSANEMIGSVNWSENYPSEEWSIGVGGAINAFADGLMKLSKSDTLFGKIFGQNQGAKIMNIAEAMKIANDFIGGTIWTTNYPSEGWAKGVGGAINAFAIPLAKLGESKVKGANVILGMIGLVRGMKLAAEEMNKVDWAKITKNYPSEEWSYSVGTAINAFAEPLAKMSEAGMSMRDITRGIKRIVYGMLFAATTLDEYDWKNADNYPKDDWVEGVGNGIGMFVKYLDQIEKSDIGRGDIKNLRRTIDAMTYAARTFSRISLLSPNMWETYPSTNWAEGVGKSVGSFVGFLEKIEKSDIGKGDIKVLSLLIDKMVYTAKRFSKNEDIWVTYPSEDWGKSVGFTINSFVDFLTKIEKSDIGKGDTDVIGYIVSKMIYTGKSFTKNADIWSFYPPVEWGDSTTQIITKFIDLINKLNRSDIKEKYFDQLDMVLYKMISIANIFTQKKDLWFSYPPAEWGNAVGESVSIFVSNASMANGVDLGVISGFESIIDTMIKMGKDFTAAGDIWKTYPTADWVGNVGEAIFSFIMASSDTPEIDLTLLKSISSGMIDIGKSFKEAGQDTWAIYPSSDWVESVSVAIESFLNLAEYASRGVDLKALKSISSEMIKMGKSFKDANIDIWTNPSTDWIESVSVAIESFLNLAEYASRGVDLKGIKSVSSEMIKMGRSFEESDWKNYPSTNWIESISATVESFLNLAEYASRGVDLKGIKSVSSEMIKMGRSFEESGKDIWSIYPSSDWAESISVATESFVNSSRNVPQDVDLKSLRHISSEMIKMGKSFGEAGDIWNIYPSSDWVDSVGTAIRSFLNNMSDIDQTNVSSSKDLIYLAKSMVRIAKIFDQNGKIWEAYPSEKWMKSIKENFIGFSEILNYLSKSKIVDTIWGMTVINMIINSAIKIDKTFSGGDWNKYPSKEWGDGVNSAISAFVDIIKKANTVSGSTKSLDHVGDAILSFAENMYKLNEYSTIFTTGGLLDNFTTSISKLFENLPGESAISSFDKLAQSIERISSVGFDSMFSIRMLSRSIDDLGESLQKLDLESVEKLSKFSGGFMILSLIDDKKLEDTIKMLKNNADQISSILSDQGRVVAATNKYSGFMGGESVVGGSTKNDVDKSDIYSDMLNVMKNIDTNVDKIASKGSNDPNQAKTDDDILAGEPSKFNKLASFFGL